MSMKNKFKNFFYLDEEEEIPTTNERRKESQSMPQPTVRKTTKERRVVQSESSSTPNIVSLQNLQKSSKVILVEPRVYAEAQDISEHLKNKRAVVVNLQRIDKDQGIRIVDFLSGTVYALGGDIQRIGTDIFLCAPDTVEVAGAISDYFYDDIQ
ncbi:cell division protein SepF [Paenisporosarcina quisquiliarum]|uniref:Cell division protein SepF n=1 Tax=Paenisporosarcina quisquiliarum TaxID=365346 RepID=A0A9X3LEQ0_9BACL|nr:cell division protein SepF [Paenisporosarcina quisquiliarum]MCZ8535566.1 cell division protein SepF [Paenisporosarcina quisquiliarum]